MKKYNKSYVYIHKRKDTGEVFYVGVGTDGGGYYRSYSHRSRNKYWHNIVNKYDFNYFIIEDNLTAKRALDREIYWIKYYGRKDLNEGTLVNMTDGGEATLGHIHSVKTKSKMSKNHSKSNNPFWGKAHTKETLNKISNKLSGENHPWYGRHHSDESKLKMSKAKSKIFLGGNNPNAKMVLDLYTGIFYDTKKDILNTFNITYYQLDNNKRFINI